MEPREARAGGLGALALIAEVALAALACAGAIGGCSLWWQASPPAGALIADLAGFERRVLLRWPDGSSLVVGFCRAGWPASASAIVRSPEKPDLAVLGFTPAPTGDPRSLGAGAFCLPDPRSLGLHGEGEPTSRCDYDSATGSGTEWYAWSFADETTGDAVTYMHWRQTP